HQLALMDIFYVHLYIVAAPRHRQRHGHLPVRQLKKGSPGAIYEGGLDTTWTENVAKLFKELDFSGAHVNELLRRLHARLRIRSDKEIRTILVVADRQPPPIALHHLRQH